MLRNGHEQGFLFSLIGEFTMSSKERRGSYHAHDIAVERDTMTPPAASAGGGEVERRAQRDEPDARTARACLPTQLPPALQLLPEAAEN